MTLTPSAVLEQCRERGVRVSVSGSDLVLRAKRGRLTPELMAALKSVKPALLLLLSHPDSELSESTFSHAVRIEPIEDAGRTVHRLVRSDTGEPLNLGLCVTEPWARSLAAEHDLLVVDEDVIN